MDEFIIEGNKRRKATKIICKRCGASKLKRSDRVKSSGGADFCSVFCHNQFQIDERYTGKTKLCNGCNKYRTYDDFYRRSYNGTLRATCVECSGDKRKLRPQPKSNVSLNMSYRLKNLYGMTVEGYMHLLSLQNGLCKICQQPETVKRNNKVVPLSVDHCHSTNKIRGLLCRSCNAGLGCLKDDCNILERSVKYLKGAL